MRNIIVRPLAAAAIALVFTACNDASQLAGPATSVDGITFEARTAGTPESSPVASQAQLLVCPSTESYTATAVIGRSGGSLSAGGATMTLPPKAVSHPTLFTMTVPASQYVEVEIVAENRPHFNFDKRVSITLDYTRCGADAAAKPLAAWHIDTQSKQLLQQMPGRRDHRSDRLTFGTDHLSGYALAW